ncbi:UDP-N-acetylmuramoyl-tripeptide--D-alanyl-D-alanine ligase [Klenkia marina]|uniref:UDP-N-acetylmuramoyl-tripeptide--D-alanyl-D-alanine ligase n=1 Tax=Klenkia marina TaxID=1960309 RepID=A0A1G4YBP1_9ACTN|nr:UDP-N-acetylmuramoyl-tripeptide--D-alanyl-D-alanine ligase [Klenkia marina]SCX50198.1 UDP-N-acetylmuramoyl-tripeptide--D-alanyl-D-alanine ligase [Klenkia marina]
MIALGLTEVAEAVGGQLTGPDATVTGKVTVDSRTVDAGDLYVALPGERVDGHDFIAAATAAGAIGAISTRPHVGASVVVVADPVEALGRLAHAVHERLPDLVTVGITGSSGKTSTKDLLGQVLGTAGATVSPPGSFNNDIGLPLTVLSAGESTRFLVLEMGARGIGHIARLCGVARPEVGVVLNVGSAHLGEFGSADAIATAKGELAEAAVRTAVLNADDPRVRGMADRATAAVLLTGTAPDSDVRATDVALDDAARASFTLHAQGEQHPVRLQVVGAHQVANALSAAGAALAAGLTPAQAAAGLSAAVTQSRWRMEVTRRPDGVVVVNDAYNANPESMRAALAAVQGMTGTLGTAGTRRIAVLGAMGELGTDAESEHARLGVDAAAAVDLVVAVGPDAAAIAAAREESVHVPDRAAARQLLAEVLRPGDVVLVKASRSYGLELLAADLLADGGAAA